MPAINGSTKKNQSNFNEEVGDTTYLKWADILYKNKRYKYTPIKIHLLKIIINNLLYYKNYILKTFIIIIHLLNYQ